MTDRADYILAMTDHERIAALTRLAVMRPDVFDQVVRQDTDRQRAIRERRTDRGPEDNDGAV